VRLATGHLIHCGQPLPHDVRAHNGQALADARAVQLISERIDQGAETPEAESKLAKVDRGEQQVQLLSLAAPHKLHDGDAAAMSKGRLTVAAGMPVVLRRRQAARPDGPDSSAMAWASTSPNGACPALAPGCGCESLGLLSGWPVSSVSRAHSGRPVMTGWMTASQVEPGPAALPAPRLASCSSHYPLGGGRWRRPDRSP
jgi:hypothetical protein